MVSFVGILGQDFETICGRICKEICEEISKAVQARFP